MKAGGKLNSFFDPEDGGDMYLQKSVDFQRTTWCYIPEDITLFRMALYQHLINERYESLSFSNSFLFYCDLFSQKLKQTTFKS
jgi:hypothetical protein